MFAAIGSSMEVGLRNEEAVKAQLAKARIKIVAEATGGNRGRTVRIDPQSGVVLVREAGGKDAQLHPKLRISPGGLKWPESSSSTTPRSCARWCPTLSSRPVTK